MVQPVSMSPAEVARSYATVAASLLCSLVAVWLFEYDVLSTVYHAAGVLALTIAISLGIVPYCIAWWMNHPASGVGERSRT